MKNNDKFTENSKKIQEHIDNLAEIAYDKIDLNKITILTGNNGQGKSLIRKLIGSTLTKKGKKLKSISMDTRTQNNPNFGALSSAMHDTEWIATSQNTFDLIKGLFKAIKDSKNDTKYIILDEFEIGCSEETILAFSDYINKELKDINIGCLIITHSRLAVKNLECNEFINIEGKTKEEWLNRKIIPTNLKELNSSDLFVAIRDRLK